MRPGLVELEVLRLIIGVDKLLEVAWYNNWFFIGDVSDIWKIYPVVEDGNLIVNKLGDVDRTSGWIKTLLLVIFSIKLSFGHLFGSP